MTRLKCEECGRSYWYEEDDFCPRCGAYNHPPKASTAVVRVDGINEKGHQGSFSHREVHKEKERRRELKMENRPLSQQSTAGKPIAKQQKKSGNGGIGAILLVLFWLFFVMQILKFFF